MKLTFKTFGEDYWNRDVKVSSGKNEKKFLKKELSKARRADAKDFIKEAFREDVA
jgi:hypothetical protein